MSKQPEPNGAISRPLYLDAADAAEELGITRYQLEQITLAAGVDACKTHRGRYTAADFPRLRSVLALMRELQVSARVVGRIQAVNAAKKAALANAEREARSLSLIHI